MLVNCPYCSREHSVDYISVGQAAMTDKQRKNIVMSCESLLGESCGKQFVTQIVVKTYITTRKIEGEN